MESNPDRTIYYSYEYHLNIYSQTVTPRTSIVEVALWRPIIRPPDPQCNYLKLICKRNHVTKLSKYFNRIKVNIAERRLPPVLNYLIENFIEISP